MDDVELGQQVKVILDNKAFDITFDKVREHYKTAWSNTDPRQSDLRETLYNTSVALEDVYRQFKALAIADYYAAFKKETEESNG